MMWLITLAILLVTLWALNKMIYSGEDMRLYMKIPGPRMLPILGNSLDVLTDRVTMFYLGRKWASQFKDIYKVFIPPHKAVFIHHPEDIEVILSSPKYIEKSVLYKIMEPWLGEGLLLSHGQKWHDRRKILTPAFHFNILRHFSHILEENSWRVVEKLRHCEHLDDVALVPLISEYTLSSICESAMGTKLDEGDTGAGVRYKKAVHEIGNLLLLRMTRAWLMNDFLFRFSSTYRQQKKVLKEIKSFPKRVIDERRKYHERFGDDLYVMGEDDEDAQVGSKKKMAMLDLLLTAEKQGLIDAAGIQEEVDTFMFEGHDTTAMGLVYTLMLLAFHEKVQDKVYSELEAAFGTSDRPARMAELQQLKYLECVIKESFRLYPPVPFISRRLGENVQLKDFTVTTGTICHIQIFDLHRRADMFEEPLLFRPERFQDEQMRHPYAYVPFSAGPRNCIGQKLALLEMKSLLAAVLRKFRLRPVTTPADLIFQADLVLRPHEPVRVAFVPRTC